MNQDNGGIIGKINTPTTTVASGVWTLQDQFEAQTSSIWPLAFPQTTIANSCRFESGNSDYLSKTFSSASDENKIFTVSTWVKRSKLGAVDSHQGIISAYRSSDGLQTDVVRFPSNDTFQFYAHTTNSGTNAQLSTNRRFRDLSAWYHIVVRVDTTQSTASNRVRIYINGTQETSFSTEPYTDQNGTVVWGLGSGVSHQIGAVGNSHHYSGYLAETIYVDNQSLDATSFGAFNPITNIWEPRGYAGTYGTNGFRLDFANSSALGNDVSGNDNDFTANNLTSVDQSTDTCSNNFATFNSLSKNDAGTVTFTEGNLKIAHSGSDSRYTGYSSIAVTQGKWYAEFKYVATSGGSDVMIGIGDLPEMENLNRQGNRLGQAGNTVGYYSDTGDKYVGPSDTSSSYGNSYAVNDIIGVAMDLDNGKLYFSKNGTFQNSGVPTSGSTGTGAISFTTGNPFIIGSSHVTTGSRTSTYSANYGSPPYAISSGNADANGHGNFEYSVPSGYFALCTKNLAEHG